MSRHLCNGQPINWGHPLNRGLVSRWQVVPWYASGPRLIDLAGRNHGTLTNGPKWDGATGRPGGHGSLNLAAASSQFVDLNVLASAAVTDFTLSVWFRTTGTNADYPGILSTSYATTNGFGILHTPNADGGGVYCALAGASNTNVGYPTSGTNDGVWRHAVMTRVSSSGDMVLYLNGETRATGTGNTGAVTPSTSLRLGNRDVGYFNGHVDGAQYWNRALSASEIKALYDDSRRGSPQALNWYTKRTYFVAVAAGGVQTATPGVATVTLSGLNPTATATGTATATPGTATATISGSSPSALASGAATVTPGIGVVTLTGTSPSAAASGAATATPGVATITISGIDDAITGTGTATVSPGFGLVTLTGVNASASVPSLMANMNPQQVPYYILPTY